ncbi:MAG: toll/interleukin-1 receptor domain-containing protein [Acidobacteriota bacterium]|nr:toll/interleukin-1 receptor domain-containing protein [Acidobacteriota bacterium]
MRDEMASHPNERASVSQIVDKGYLADLVATTEIRQVLHYDSNLESLSVEDPHFVFYLRNLDWDEFRKKAGFTTARHDHPYDFALSFAGEDRAFAEALKTALEELDCSVFYDENEEDRILAEDLEAFLAPIYKSDSAYVIAILGPKYGEKRWTRFESDQFKERFGEHRVIPIWSKHAPPTAFDKTANIGGRRFNPEGDLVSQARAIAAVCEKKLRG